MPSHQRMLPKAVGAAARHAPRSGVLEASPAELDELAQLVKDHNYRMFAAGEEIHAVTAGQHLHDADPFLLFDQLQAQASRPIDASHAFYLGYEMAKAVTALTLGKDYRQDEALDWGFLTRAEAIPSARHAILTQPRSPRRPRTPEGPRDVTMPDDA